MPKTVNPHIFYDDKIPYGLNEARVLPGHISLRLLDRYNINRKDI